MKKHLLHSFIIAALFALAVAAFFLWPRVAGGQHADTAPIFPRAAMTIERGDGGKLPFTIEIATTREQEMYGLMFRRSLADDAGMLFIFTPEQPVSMWMKNTYIPLDMLFVRADGTIAKIVAQTRPLDLTPIPSDVPVHGVIELNGGVAAKDGIKTGDKVLFSAFSGAP